MASLETVLVRRRPADPRLARALRLAWPAALVAAIWFSVGRLGFAVLDEGMIASYSRRILNGEVPHSDIVSVRPLGSALIHIVDLAVPLPLFTTIRLMGLAEVVAYSLLFAAFLFRRGPLRWTLTESFAVAATVLVNLHTFPLMTWYTIDGLLFTAAGLVLAQAGARSGSRRTELAAMLCLGAAAVMKQSFVPAAFVGVAVLWRGSLRDGVAPALRRLLIAAIPGLLYLGGLAALGAFPDALKELTAGRAVYGRPLLEGIGLITTPVDRRPAFTGHFPFEVPLIVGALLVAGRAWPERRVLINALQLAAVAVVVYVALAGDLAYVDSWSIELTWALVSVVVLSRIARGGWSGPAVAVLVVAWMTMLSWGHELPALVGGTIALCAIALLLGDVRALPRGPTPALAAVVVVVAIGAVFVHARRESPYYDRPASELTFDLGTVDHDLAGIETSPVTGAYVQQAARCIRQYPARQVALLPDNAGLYAAFGLNNPFPLDWVIRGDYAGQTQKIVAAAQRLRAQGDYLVLFQIVSGFDLGSLRRLPEATRHDVPVMVASDIYDPPLARRLIAILRGRHIVCGPFLGIYARSSGDSSSTGEPPRRSESVAASSTATTRRAARTSVSGVAPV
jgi:hypothetical protein